VSGALQGEAPGGKGQMSKGRVICIAIACILALGACYIGYGLYTASSGFATYAYEGAVVPASGMTLRKLGQFGFPAPVVLYPGARIQAVRDISSEMRKPSAGFQLGTTDSPAKVTAFYRARLSANGNLQSDSLVLRGAPVTMLSLRTKHGLQTVQVFRAPREARGMTIAPIAGGGETKIFIVTPMMPGGRR